MQKAKQITFEDFRKQTHQRFPAKQSFIDVAEIHNMQRTWVLFNLRNESVFVQTSFLLAQGLQKRIKGIIWIRSALFIEYCLCFIRPCSSGEQSVNEQSRASIKTVQPRLHIHYRTVAYRTTELMTVNCGFKILVVRFTDKSV